MEPETEALLEKLFAENSELYQDRDFQRRIGWGKKPALINVDLANTWTQEGSPFYLPGHGGHHSSGESGFSRIPG